MGQKHFGLFVLFGLVSAQTSWGHPIPKEIRQFLIEERNRPDLVEKFEAIPTLPPKSFTLKLLNSARQKLMGAGFNGFVFKDAENRASKFSYAIIQGTTLVPFRDPPLPLPLAETWALLRSEDIVTGINFAEVRGNTAPVLAFPVREEFLGTLIFAAYNPRETVLPDLISEDEFAYRRPFVEGIPLNKILQGQRTSGHPYQKYNRKKILEEVIFWQDLGEKVLDELGVTFDLLNSGNFIVQGTPENPTIAIVDHSLILPSPEALEYYRSIGRKIPEPRFSEFFHFTLWPSVPQHIVFNKNWSFNFGQAIEYVKMYFGVTDWLHAVKLLAKIPEWPVEIAPMAADYSNIRTAKEILAKLEKLGTIPCSTLVE